MENKEQKSATINLRYIDGQEESRIVEGYAVRFNEPSENMGFIETILPEAITEDTIKRSDIFAKFNHRDDAILARSRFGEGSLSLELREDGLFYQFEAPHTQFGDELIEHIKRGEITGSSFAFSLPDDGKGDKWENRKGEYRRTIKVIDKLYDISPVFIPAYSTTSCSKRAQEVIDAGKEINEKLDSIMREIEELTINLENKDENKD